MADPYAAFSSPTAAGRAALQGRAAPNAAPDPYASFSSPVSEEEEFEFRRRAEAERAGNFTPEQQRAIALANGRARAAEHDRLRAAGFSEQEIQAARAGNASAKPTPEQLKAAIISADKAGDTESARRFAEMYRATMAERRPERSLLGALGEGAVNLPGHVVQAWHTATVDLPNTLIDPKRRQAAAAGVSEALHGAADTARGYVQQVRNLSPAEYRGSAPSMNTAPAEAMERATVAKYGVNVAPQRVARALQGDLGQPNLNAYRTAKDTIAEHPLSVVATVAPVVGKPMAEALERAGGLAKRAIYRGPSSPNAPGPPPPASKAAKMAEILSAGKRSASTASDVRQAGLEAAVNQVGKARLGAYEATTEAADRAKAARLAAALQADAEASARKAAERAAFDEPIGVGEAAHNSDIGAPAQRAAMQARGAIEAEMRAQDDTLRGARDALVADVEGRGVSLADLPEARAALKEAETALRPDPASSPTVTSLPTPEEGKLHQLVVSALQERRVPLTAAEAEAAQKLGYPVEAVNGPRGPQFYRTFKTSFEAVDNLRRRMGEAFSGRAPEGFEGVPRKLMERKYAQLQEIENAFTGNAHQAVQDSWAAAKAKLAPYEDSALGKAVTGRQGDTDIPSLPPSKVPQAILAGGRGTYEQFAALTGQPAAARQVAQDIVEREFRDPTTGRSYAFDTIAKKIRPGTQLGDMLQSPLLADLRKRVEQHVTRLRDAKLAGVDAEAFTITAKERAAAVKAAETEAKAAEGRAAGLEAEAVRYQAEFVKLKNLPDAQAIRHAQSLVDQMAAKGLVSSADHDAFYALVKAADTAAAQKALRDKIVKGGLTAIGFGAAGKVGFDLLEH